MEMPGKRNGLKSPPTKFRPSKNRPARLFKLSPPENFRSLVHANEIAISLLRFYRFFCPISEAGKICWALLPISLGFARGYNSRQTSGLTPKGSFTQLSFITLKRGNIHRSLSKRSVDPSKRGLQGEFILFIMCPFSNYFFDTYWNFKYYGLLTQNITVQNK